MKTVRPGLGPKRSGYGPRNGSYHYGLDLAAGTGQPIFAFAAGEVIGTHTGCVVGFTDCGKQGGNWIKIRHGNGFDTWYLHLSEVLVSQGQKVKAGQLIGKEGNTGFSTGPHLHFGMYETATQKPINPEPYVLGGKTFPGRDPFSEKVIYVSLVFIIALAMLVFIFRKEILAFYKGIGGYLT